MPYTHAVSDDATMSLGDHLEELRKRLVLSLVGILIAAAVMLYFGQDMVSWLLVPLLNVHRYAGLPMQVINTGVTTGFAVYLKVSLIAGLVISSPWVVFQIWKFVAPGLYEQERKVILTILPFSAVMSALAVAFMYTVMLPICLAFMVFFSIGFPSPELGEAGWLDTLTGLTVRGDIPLIADTTDGRDPTQADGTTHTIPLLNVDPLEPTEGQAWIKLPERELRVAVGEQVLVFAGQAQGLTVRPLLDLGQYISFVAALTLGTLIAFQLPVVMMVLGWTGMVDPAWLARYRRHALLIALVLGMLLTPADPLSMIALAVPLYILFEFGMLVMRVSRGRPDAE